MQDEDKKLSTDDEVVRIMMDIYNLTEQEARKALREVTARNGWADF